MLNKRADTISVKNFEPRILGLCCNWAASLSIANSYPNPCLLPMTGSGVIQSESTLETFAKSAEAVFIAACSHHVGNNGASYKVCSVKP